MIRLNLPPLPLKVQRQKSGLLIYDILRRRYVTLTPEEWVRQHFIHYLIDHQSYPAGLMANEVSIRMPGNYHNTRRCDTVLYHKQDCVPQMLIEYKAPTVRLTQAIFNQVFAYNSVLRVPYLIMSNGLQHICLQLDYDTLTYHTLPAVPHYEDLK